MQLLAVARDRVAGLAGRGDGLRVVTSAGGFEVDLGVELAGEARLRFGSMLRADGRRRVVRRAWKAAPQA
ncbi:hypothetical protein GCM10009565_30000 [Amycolatopsis albidoflavus]